MYNKAESMLNEIGFDNITVKKICFNNRLKTTAGQYIHKTKTIEISTRHFVCCSDEDIMNTIIHEISHNICEEKYGSPGNPQGHNEKWIEIAKYITEKTGYVIEQYLSDSVQENEDNIFSIPKYFHRFKCRKCGHEYTAYSKYEDPDKVRKQKCIGCLSGYKNLGYEYSEGDFKCIRSGFHHYEYKYKL